MMGFDPMTDLKFIRPRARERSRRRHPERDRDRRRRHQGRELRLPRQPQREHARLARPEAHLLGPLKPLENLLLRSPIVPWSYFASRAYHDGFWYPVNGKPRVRTSSQTTGASCSTSTEKEKSSPRRLPNEKRAVPSDGAFPFVRALGMGRRWPPTHHAVDREQDDRADDGRNESRGVALVVPTHGLSQELGDECACDASSVVMMNPPDPFQA
jgi:hypothetical protein